MLVEIHFQASYTYAKPVSLSVHVYRLFPRGGRSVVIREADFKTKEGAQVSYHRDLFENEVASCFHPGLTSELVTTLRLEIQLTPFNPFAFLLSPHALELPFQYTEAEAKILAPYRDDSPAISLPFWRPKLGKSPTIDTLLDLNLAFNRSLRYERREEGDARSPEETVRAGSGACRDFAVLLAASLRGMGLAARLASGFVLESGEAERKAEGALHEWVETYLPGAGWLGLDPTNGTVCDHRHIPTAVGLTATEIAPTSGRYFHDEQIKSTMDSIVSVRAVDESFEPSPQRP